MLIKPFIFGSVRKDLATEFKKLSKWAATFLGRSSVLEGGDFSIIPCITTGHVYLDSQTFDETYHLLNLFNQIDDCFPFVFFVIGDNYGDSYFHIGNGKGGANIETAIKLGHDWLLEENIRHSSLLHILIYYTTLKSKKFYTSDAEEKLAPFIFIRRPTYERTVRLMSENGLFAYQRAQSVLQDAAKLDSLKREILTNDSRMRFFNLPEQLIDQILADMKRCAKTMSNVTERQQFVQTQSTEAFIDALNERVEFQNENLNVGVEKDKEGNGKITVLVGDSQCGKHSILTYWLSQFKLSHPNVAVSIFHAKSDVPSSEMNSIVYLADNAIRKFRSFHKEFDRSLRGGRVLECLEAKQLHLLEQEFKASLALGPCLLVVMGVDCLTTGPHFGSGSEIKVKQLPWIPQTLPKHCHIIMTTLPNDMTLHALSKRNDTEIIDVSSLAQDVAFKMAFLEKETISITKFPKPLLKKVLDSPVSNSIIHLSAISRILANQGALNKIEYETESILELVRPRDLMNREVRKWTNQTSSSVIKKLSNGELDRSTDWIPKFLRFVVLSRYGIPTRCIFSLLRQIIGENLSSPKLTERWWSFWIASSYIFAAGSHNTIKISSNNIRRGLESCLFDSTMNSFPIWRRRFIRFLCNLPDFADDPNIVDELVYQTDQSGDMIDLINLISDGNTFMRLVSSDLNREVYALSLLLRIQQKGPKDFLELIENWLKRLGALPESTETSRQQNETSPSEDTTLELKHLSVPRDPIARSDFTWTICDWLFVMAKLKPGESGGVEVANALGSLIPPVTQFCENQLANVPLDDKAHGRLAGFLTRCSIRFAAPSFNNLQLALQILQKSANICKAIDNHLAQSKTENQENPTKAIKHAKYYAKLVRYSHIMAQLESCEMCFKLGLNDTAREIFDSVQPMLEKPTWPPIIGKHLFCLSLFLQSSSQSEECERFLRAAADISVKWYGNKHTEVAETLLALGCILGSRATTARPMRAKSAATISRPNTTAEGIQQVLDFLFTTDEVEECFREAIEILEERRVTAGGDTQSLAFACAALGRFLSSQPTTSAKREAAKLLQKAADLSLLEKGVEDFSVRWLRGIVKGTLLAMPPAWFTILHTQQAAQDAVSNMATKPRPSTCRPTSRGRISATLSSDGPSVLKSRPTTAVIQTAVAAQVMANSSNNGRAKSAAMRRPRPKTSLGISTS